MVMGYTLRSKVIRLAQENPELRSYLLPVLKSAAMTYVKQKIQVPVKDGGFEEVLAEVHGSWAIHKSLGGVGWTVTFVPKGLALSRPRTQTDARALLEAILAMLPNLTNASTESEVLAHQREIVGIIRNPPKASGTAKRAPSVNLVQKREQVIQWLLEAGMRSKGGRSGKAGDFFYPPLPYGETPTLAISVGARDLLLNQYLMRGRDERWVMKSAELLSKVDEDLVKKWVAMSKSAPTRSEVRGGR